MLRGWWQALGHWGRGAAIVWAIAFAVISVRVMLSKPRTHNDYLTFANTARHWVEGKGLYQQWDDAGFYDDFRYSPIVACSLVPLSLLPDLPGSIAWRLVNLGIFLAGLCWWGRRVLTPKPNVPQLAILFLLVLPLSVGNINNGQSNPLVLGLLLAGVAAVTEERWNLCSACIAGAVLFKVYPIAVGLLLIALYPRKLGGRLALALAAGLALPFLLQRPSYVAEQYGIWFNYLVTEDRQMLPLAATYRDVRLFFRAVSAPLDARAYMFLQLITGAAAALVCLLAQRWQWSQARLLTMLTGLGCVWMTVFGVATESCTYMLLAPTCAWAVMQNHIERRSWIVRGTMGFAFALFLIAQVANWFKHVADFHALGVQPFAGILVLVALLAAEVRRSLVQTNEVEEPYARSQAA
jgi:hypothetical protein